jgi:uncharacterized RDD family membrane protein YckC
MNQAIAPTRSRQLPAPSVRRRLASFFYEGVLLFGVVVPTALVFGPLVQQRHALYLRGALMAVLFCVLGLYFTWFWVRGGQTLAMKTWHIRVEGPDGAPLTRGRALVRYLAAWLWFLPPIGAAASMDVGTLGVGGFFAVLIAYVLAYALLARLHPQRQFLHDLLCGTRLVDARPSAAT